MTKRSAAKNASIAEWDALLSRYPLASPAEMGRQLLSVIGSNAVVLFEALLLTGIAWIQARMVPRSALMEKPQPLRARLLTLVFGAFWLTLVYAIILGAMLESGAEVLAAVRSPSTLLSKYTLLWPLLLTLTFAVADAARDWMHWRAAGGFFLSTPGFNAAARWLTLFLGGIPFFVPLAFLVWAIATLSEWLKKRGGTSQASAATEAAAKIAPFLAPALFAGIFAVMGWLLRAGVSGWAVGYCSAKLLSESFLVFLPLIAHKARAEEAGEEAIAS